MNGYDNNGYNGGGGGSDNYNGYNNYYQSPRDPSQRLQTARAMINSGDIDGADRELNFVPENERNAEWNYLMGTVMYKKGWLEEANRYFGAAYGMEPDNIEYQNMYSSVQQQCSGKHGGNNTSSGTNWCSWDDICTVLICSDCMCDLCDLCNN